MNILTVPFKQVSEVSKERKKEIIVFFPFQPGDKALIEKQLFTRNDSLPKNYTIIFKYIASEQSPNITCAKINVQNAVN